MHVPFTLFLCNLCILRILSVYCLLHLFLLFLPAIAQNISLGSSLSTSDQNPPSWLSPSGEFAFGFPNGDNPVQKGSKVELTTSGNLALSDHQGKEVWSAESSGGSATVSAAMLDSGNFVLFSEGSVILASFDNPTDTILPMRTLKLGSNLRSLLKENDYSNENFALRLVALPTYFQYLAYWKSKTTGNGSELVFNLSGLIQIQLKDGGSSILAPPVNNASELYQRASIDFDGVFRKYVRRNDSGPIAGFRNVTCYKKSSALLNGKMRPRLGSTTFIKVLKNIPALPPSNEGGRKKDGGLNLLGSVLLGSSVFFAVLFLAVIIFFSYKKKSQAIRPDSSMLGKSLSSFTYRELEVATGGGFKEQLGRGSFGTVYKGSLALAGSAAYIAVKMLEQVFAESEQEFIAEVVAIGQTHHKNLTKLIEFCN
ncbi:hypothetical protein ACLOJK_017439 [Asimina triloba]